MSIEDADAALTIVEEGRQRVRARLQTAFENQVTAHPELGEVAPAEVEQLLDAAIDRAGASLWRIGLAEGAADRYGVTVREALAHPAVSSAEQLVGAPAGPAGVDELPLPVPVPLPDEGPAPEVEPWAPGEDETSPGFGEDAAAETVETAPQALRVPAVHSSGIETLKAGEDDIELRLSDAGLDVLRRSSGAAIGRLEWAEITSVEVEPARKGLRGRRRSQSLQVRTARGHAQFDLPGLSEEEATEHLEPLLARLRASGELGSQA